MRKERREALGQIRLILFVLIVYSYFLDGLLFILLVRSVVLFPTSISTNRSLPSYTRSATLFHVLCALNQLFQDTSPDAPRLLLDFVGQRYDVSKTYLFLVDGIVWFFHMILVAIAVEEAKCRLDQERPNALDVTIPDHTMEETPSLQESRDSEDDVYQSLLPSSQPQSHISPVSHDNDWILPTTRKPIAYINWSSLWTSD